MSLFTTARQNGFEDHRCAFADRVWREFIVPSCGGTADPTETEELYLVLCRLRLATGAADLLAQFGLLLWTDDLRLRSASRVGRHPARARMEGPHWHYLADQPGHRQPGGLRRSRGATQVSRQADAAWDYLVTLWLALSTWRWRLALLQRRYRLDWRVQMFLIHDPDESSNPIQVNCNDPSPGDAPRYATHRRQM